MLLSYTLIRILNPQLKCFLIMKKACLSFSLSSIASILASHNCSTVIAYSCGVDTLETPSKEQVKSN